MTLNFYTFARTLLAALTSALLLAMAAHAGGDHSKPLHGGIVAESSAFEAELVVKQHLVTIYLTNHGKAIPSTGVTGKLTILSEGKTQAVNLSASAGNQLQATLPAPLKSGKFVAQIALPNKPTASVRFELK